MSTHRTRRELQEKLNTVSLATSLSSMWHLGAPHHTSSWHLGLHATALFKFDTHSQLLKTPLSLTGPSGLLPALSLMLSHHTTKAHQHAPHHVSAMHTFAQQVVKTDLNGDGDNLCLPMPTPLRLPLLDLALNAPAHV
ncbi:hypothetical protein DFH94DRAFT_691844 [Russula ochroleuca]|uniref:Uncharacterized protein n=1 Tax=Russula ochroleuca TaxID=152965 RepID=A0A9P5T9C3_9AGAM|nr:hypothetical protein DFH94DRAFT_691844 [Russula ochroleuca]